MRFFGFATLPNGLKIIRYLVPLWSVVYVCPMYYLIQTDAIIIIIWNGAMYLCPIYDDCWIQFKFLLDCVFSYDTLHYSMTSWSDGLFNIWTLTTLIFIQMAKNCHKLIYTTLCFAKDSKNSPEWSNFAESGHTVR